MTAAAVIAGLLLFQVAAGPTSESEPRHPVRRDRGVMIPMRDRIRLATDIYRPDRPGRFPVVLSRTPYGRSGFSQLADSLAARGYVAVWQDVRGRFDSEGTWEPFVAEADDGFDAIAWAAAQPWSDGQVFMLGGSYVAMVQWLAAKRHPPSLAGLITLVSPGDFYEDFFWEGGAFSFGSAALWSTYVDGKGLVDLAPLPWDSAFRQLPLVAAVRTVGHETRAFHDWITHPANDGYWRRLRWNEDIPAFDFPVLHIGGWFDVFQKGTIENFRRMATGAVPRARVQQHLVVGPWGHTSYEQTGVGAVDFGAHSVLGMTPLVMRWLDRYARGNTRESFPAVRVFMMGENQWREYPAWPAPGTRSTSYFLRSGGRANGADGDGVLLTQRPPAREAADRYRYDPANPVPTKGGGNCCWADIIAWGPLDQRPIESRPDVLVYSTPPLEEDVKALGPVQLVLWVASTAPGTDFTGKLVDVAPDGIALNLTDGIQRLTRIRRGSPTEVLVDLWNTGHVFKRGHRIRLEVSSSNFPRYARNLNTGKSPETTTAMAIAGQTVFHDAARPSRLIISTIP